MSATMKHIPRRKFVGGALVGLGLPMAFYPHGAVARPAHRSALSELGVGCIGLRYQGSVIAHKAAMYGNIVAVCDVDKNVRDPVKAAFGSTPKDYEIYHDLLNNKSVDVVTIGTPDHWHTKMVMDACRAGKDVYCEKPLTLTIDEGIQLRRVVAQTDRIVQVGSWQRSDYRFRQAVEMVRSGRIGKLQTVDVVLGKNKVGGPFDRRPRPKHFNWDMWQGQTPDVPYIEERSHYTFRWWYEYSGGQMTDWGAHHLDIAQWAINSLPVKIASRAKFPKKDPASFNVALDFEANYQFANGVEMRVSDTGRNGIMFTGDAGRIFVNRGTLTGKPVEQLEQQPLPRESWQVYEHDNLDRSPRAGKLDAIVNHMGNFIDCVQKRQRPISDVESQHRSVSTCHLGNISMHLGRELNWNAQTEEFVGDSEADAWLKREQRSGFETT